MSDAGFILNATNELYRIFDALNENYFDGKLQLKAESSLLRENINRFRHEPNAIVNSFKGMIGSKSLNEID